MSENSEEKSTAVPEPAGNGLGALITTGIVSAVAAFSASLLYFHYFPPVPPEKPVPVAVVDMVKLGLSVAQMNKDGDTSAFMNTGRAIAELTDMGYIVLDSRMVISAPPEYIREPSQLVAGAPDAVGLEGGYQAPKLIEGVKGGGK